MTLTLLFFGDVVGDVGREALYRALPELRAEFGADAVIVNGENAAGGRGITPKLCEEFFRNGADVITLGDHAWDQQELIGWLDKEEAAHVLRPFNHQSGTPGHGSCVLDTPKGKVAVLCLIGRTFLRPGADNPFTLGYEEAQRLRGETRAVFCDFHAETTSEKIAAAWRLDGIASAVVGTHTHVQTADERILPGGTAALTDVGMCGSRDGVIGRDREAVLEGCITALPCKFPIGPWPAQVSGVAVCIDTETGRAISIERINRSYDK